MELPSRENLPPEPETPREDTEPPPQDPVPDSPPSLQDTTPPAQLTPVPEPTNIETPVTSHAPSETDSTQPTTPSSATAPAPSRPQPGQGSKISHRPNSSIVPIIPAIPHISLPSRPVRQAPISSASEASKNTEEQPSNADHLANAVDVAAQAKEEVYISSEQNSSSGSTAKAAPKSWADLVRTMAPAKSNSEATDATPSAQPNGVLSKTESLADVLSSYSVESIRDNSKISFLEPRGLVNTGNMCYMNSVRSALRRLLTELTFGNRFCKFSSSAFHFIIFSIILAKELPIVSEVIPH